MAVDMFIKIGDLKGESKDSKHKDQVDVHSWSWGMSNSGTTHKGGGGGSGKVNVHDLTFTKYIDFSSIALQLACANGRHYPSALLTMRKAGQHPLEYLKIKMTEVLVTSVITGGSGGQDRLTENITLNFARVSVDYQKQAANGGADGGPASYTWDIAANAET